MAESTQWSFPRELQPRTADVAFDLRTALDAVVMLRANVPEDAFTASLLGTERAGNGVVIRDDGLTLTIGYLITEAESVWLTTNSGATVAGHPLAYDFASGFGLVVPLGKLDAPSLARGSATTAGVDDDVFVVGHGGLAHALKARVIAKREFAGYWEYMLGDLVVDVAGERVSGLAYFYRKVVRLVPPGTLVPLTLARDGAVTRTDVKSADRGDFLKKPQLQ